MKITEMSFRNWFSRFLSSKKPSNPREAYNTWAEAYDNQPGNLMLDLDEEMTARFLDEQNLTGKTIVDIGCGTGRHWKKLIDKNPKRIVGFDVSSGMLEQLKKKFPAAETYLLHNEKLSRLEDNSCDLAISTLTIAHIESIEQALTDWNRVLKPGAELWITENHPDALSRGGQRTFKHEGKLVSVKNYVHSFDALRRLTGQLGWQEIRFVEKPIDDSVKNYYVQQNALPVFEKFRGVNIIYGMHLRKTDDTV